jgi:hypothetical protein
MENKTMNRLLTRTVALLAACIVSVSAWAQISFSEDFEGLDPTTGSPSLANGGWLVFVNVFDDYPGCSQFLFPYNNGAPFPAPVSNESFSNIAAGQTGQALNVFSDYANQAAQTAPDCIETNVFQQRVLSTADAGSYTFTFDTEVPGALGPGVSTYGFIKLLDPNNGFNLDIFEVVDTGTGGAKSIAFDLDASVDGKILQWGFANTTALNEFSARWYDNVEVALDAVEPPIEPPIEPPLPPTDGNVEGIPSLNQLGLLLLAFLVGGFGLFASTRRS